MQLCHKRITLILITIINPQLKHFIKLNLIENLTLTSSSFPARKIMLHHVLTTKSIIMEIIPIQKVCNLHVCVRKRHKNRRCICCIPRPLRSCISPRINFLAGAFSSFLVSSNFILYYNHFHFCLLVLYSRQYTAVRQ